MRTSFLVLLISTLICSVVSTDQVPINCPQGYINVAGKCVVAFAQSPLVQTNTQLAGGPIPSALVIPSNIPVASINTFSDSTTPKSGSLSALKPMQTVKTSENNIQPPTTIPSIATFPLAQPPIHTQQSSFYIKPDQQMQNNTIVNNQNIVASAALPVPSVTPIDQSLFAPLNFTNSNPLNSDSNRNLDLNITTTPNSILPVVQIPHSNQSTNEANQQLKTNGVSLNNAVNTSVVVSPIASTGGSTIPSPPVTTVPTTALPNNIQAAGTQIPQISLPIVHTQNLNNQIPINMMPTMALSNNASVSVPSMMPTPIPLINSNNCPGIWMESLKSCLPISCPDFYEWNKVTKTCEIPKPNCKPGYTWSGLYCLPTSIISGAYPPINSTQQLARGLVCPQGQWKCKYHVCPQGFTYISPTCLPVSNTSECPSVNLNNNGGCNPDFVLEVDVRTACVVGKSRWNGTVCEPIIR